MSSRPQRPVRVLLATSGWPCGILEIGSWARRQGLADVVVFPLPPEGLGLSDQEGPEGPVVECGDREDLLAAIRKRGQPPPPAAAVDEALLALGAPFLRKLIEFDPHVVGFRLEGGRFEAVQRYVQAVRLFLEAEIVLGGPTATSHPREVLEDTAVDYVFAGEAEESFAQFLRLAWQRDSKDRQPEIPGLAYRYGGRVYWNTLPRDGYGQTVLDGDRPQNGEKLRSLRTCFKTDPKSPDCVSPPVLKQVLRNLVRPVVAGQVLAENRLDWSLVSGGPYEFDSLFFTGGRGCPGACTFCAKLHGQEVRIKGARQLLDEIEAVDAEVAAGRIQVSRWRLFEHVADPAFRDKVVAWAAVYDEDFLLHRRRAIEFLRLWYQSPLKDRYRLSLQTNPCSLLTSEGQVHEELLDWIDRVKPMVQLGAESFHPEVLARWHKRHNLPQLNTVLDALDRTRQDYTVFQLLTDFDTTPEELIDSLWLLIQNAYRRRRMRIASSPYTIPLYDSDTRPYLEYGRRRAARTGHFTEYEAPQPAWMDPLVAELADLADAELRWALHLPQRESALIGALEVVLARIAAEAEPMRQRGAVSRDSQASIAALKKQAAWAMEQIKEVRFQGLS